MADLLRLHELQPTRYPHLLQSALTGTPQSRFDILFAFPGSSVESHPSDSQPFLSVLDQGWAESRIPKPIDASLERLPFRGGWFIYLGYELANEIEPSLDLPGFDLGLPTAFMTRFPAAIIRDHEQQCLWLVSEDGSHLDDMDSDLRLLGPELDTTADASTSRLGDDLEEDEPSAYLQGVSKIRDYIRDGDVFQVNLARRWWVRIDQRIKHSRVFRSLRQHNPAPFSALVTAGERAIISSSPERLVEVKDGLAITRPIAGTRPRGADGGGEPSVSDEFLRDQLLNHPKERAEHIMLIDLERNDLGRICQPGTVRVDELMTLETYRHVHHIVSGVIGRLREDVTPGDVIRAVFPGGTITGCPKVRCMEIIAELEGVGRGPYTGSVGYLNRDGDMDLNILIRSIVRDGSRALIQAGAGIVADSLPQRELDETRAKAKGMIRSIIQ